MTTKAKRPPSKIEITAKAPAPTDADRIARLEAELAEARREYAERETAYWDDRRAEERILADERAAHERTKARVVELERIMQMAKSEGATKLIYQICVEFAGTDQDKMDHIVELTDKLAYAAHANGFAEGLRRRVKP